MGKKPQQQRNKRANANAKKAEPVAVDKEPEVAPIAPVIAKEKEKEKEKGTEKGRERSAPLLVPALFAIAGVVAILRVGTDDPWVPWIGGIAAACAIASRLLLRDEVSSATPAIDGDIAALASSPSPSPSPSHRWIDRTVLVLAALPFFMGVLVSLEFVKDDAYISFRYAHNLVTGHGLVFNTGERVEGFTNFLWVLLLAPFEALGWDLFQVCEVLGTLLGTTCIILTAQMTRWINKEHKLEAQLWGAVWLSCSSSFALWAKSGLEQPLAALLPIASAFLLWRARENATGLEPKKRTKRYLIAGLMMGAGCMTRPELHLLAILVGAPLVFDVVRTRKVTRAELYYALGILAITVPCHTFRYAYYGSLIPNTFYVKTGTGANVWHVGFNTLHDMFLFNHMGLLAIAAPLAFANRTRLVEKITMAIIAVSFMAYYVAVGVDEMQWHRLYLPALPFLCVLAALGAQNGVNAIVSRFAQGNKAVRDIGFAFVWVSIAISGGLNFRFTYREMHGFDGHGDLAGTFHPDMGKFLTRHERAGALVAFQDVGSTPYHAPDINFLDFIGLVDTTVAHARHDYGLHAFVNNSDDQTARTSFDRDMRDYFFRRNPEWAILTIYGNRNDEARLHSEFEGDPTGGSFGDDYRNNPFQFGIWDDSRFRNRYVPVRTWPRGAGYYLALWRRKDLWQKTPREVVLETPPSDLQGAHAKFEGGLELIGSELTKQTIERHEVFITTWWKLPGPMDPDLYFFVHVRNSSVQVPADHIPGDWMYPADRWKAGEILEDRILFQLPPFLMEPGQYSVYIGAYRMSTGERLKIVDGGAGGGGRGGGGGGGDDSQRVLLGTFEARRLQPIFDQLIPPTRVDVMRKYPGRLLDSR